MKTDGRTARKPFKIGARYGRLIVLSPPMKGRIHYEYDFRCDCGKVCRKSSVAVKSTLRRNSTPSCGCFKTETSIINGRGNKTHGLSGRALYDVYRQMIRRCYVKHSKDYHAWGGRGITICDAWLNDIHLFFDWAHATGYHKGVTIERINNDDGYHPMNCTWIPNCRQGKNTRRVRWIECRGQRLSVTDWATERGVPYRRLMARLNMGWDAERALFT